MSDAGRLAVTVCGLSFRNLLVLAAGTAGYGREIDGIVDLESVGGLVTKAVSPEPRHGAAAPRVADFDGGMINAVGLANPGLDRVRENHLPWLASHHSGLRKIVNVVGSKIEDYPAVVAALDAAVATGAPSAGAIDAFELNVSCPNVRAGGMEFGADPQTLTEVVSQSRAATKRPLFVKLSPASANIVSAAETAARAGADGLTLVNTLPGLVVDVATRRPMLGFGSGGVSGNALTPIGVLATWKVTRAVSLPVIGAGGVRSAMDALQYIVAGASLVAMGTAALANPRQPARLVRDLERWCAREGIESLASLRGTLEWPT